MSPDRAKRSAKRLQGQAGYTLVELLVVIALAGLMMTAVPAFASRLLPSARFDARFEELKDALAETRAQAAAGGNIVEFDFEAFGEALTFTPGALAKSKETGLVFYGGDGATGGVLVLKIENRSRALEIDWLTGRAFEIEAQR